MLNKKSQVTLFMILGFVLLVIAGFIFYMQNLEGTKKDIVEKQKIAFEPQKFNAYVESCISEVSNPLVKEIGLKAGSLDFQDKRAYEGKSYYYMCKNEKDIGCINSAVTRDSMEKELNIKIKEGLEICLDLGLFDAQGYNIKAGEKEVKTTIAVDSVIVDLNYPIEITKGDFKLDLNKFRVDLKHELGRLYDLAVQILNSEIENSSFQEDEWMHQHGHEIEIEKHKPYPDVVYSLKKDNDGFLFAIHGEDVINRIGEPILKENIGYCHTERDNNCYFNSEEAKCNSNGGLWSLEKPSNCKGISTFSGMNCVDGNCSDCYDLRHGESVCLYDAITGRGFDPAGSRYFKKSCIDGREYLTECADYRQEICAEFKDGTRKRALCRANRWWDCSKQGTKDDCENSEIRDCYWIDWLYKAKPFAQLQYGFEDKMCVPFVSPGLKFWEGKGENVCHIGDEQFDCDGTSCPQNWVDSSTTYCSSLGDCGAYFNYIKNITLDGYYNSDGETRPYIILVPKESNEHLTSGLSALKTNQTKITGNEFFDLRTSQKTIQNQLNYFQKRQSELNQDSLVEINGLPFGPVEVWIHLDMLHTARCNLWEAPNYGNFCDLCNKKEKPCSEYRCKSLGKNCFYSEINGVGNCTYQEFTEQSLQLEFIGVLDEHKLVPDVIKETENEKDIGYFEGITQEKIDVEEDEKSGVEGYIIENNPLYPFSNLVVLLSSNIPIRCRASDLIQDNYNTIITDDQPYSKMFPVLINIEPPYKTLQDVKVLQQFSSPLQGLEMKDMGETLESVRGQLKNAMGNQSNQMNEVMLRSISNQIGLNTTNVDEIIDKMKADYEATKERSTDNLNQLQEDFLIKEQNRAYKFINCRDMAGQVIDKKLFLHYKVGDDTIAPILLRTFPEDKSKAGEKFNLKLDLNEPSECRYSAEDKTFDFMENQFNCSSSVYDYEDIGIFRCNKDIQMPSEKNLMYVSCKDQPEEIQDLFLNLKKDANFSILNAKNKALILGNMYTQGISLSENKINVFNPAALKEEELVIGVNESSVLLNITFGREKICKITENKDDKFNYITEGLDCGGIEQGFACNNNFIMNFDEKKFYIKCKNKIEAERNVNEENYVLEFYK